MGNHGTHVGGWGAENDDYDLYQIEGCDRLALISNNETMRLLTMDEALEAFVMASGPDFLANEARRRQATRKVHASAFIKSLWPQLIRSELTSMAGRAEANRMYQLL